MYCICNSGHVDQHTVDKTKEHIGAAEGGKTCANTSSNSTCSLRIFTTIHKVLLPDNKSECSVCSVSMYDSFFTADTNKERRWGKSWGGGKRTTLSASKTLHHVCHWSVECHTMSSQPEVSIDFMSVASWHCLFYCLMSPVALRLNCFPLGMWKSTFSYKDYPYSRESWSAQCFVSSTLLTITPYWQFALPADTEPP